MLPSLILVYRGFFGLLGFLNMEFGMVGFGWISMGSTYNAQLVWVWHLFGT